MSDLKTRSMQFLYKWVTKGHLSNLRKGMVEELEAFVTDELSARELHQASAKMQAEADKTQASGYTGREEDQFPGTSIE